LLEPKSFTVAVGVGRLTPVAKKKHMYQLLLAKVRLCLENLLDRAQARPRHALIRKVVP